MHVEGKEHVREVKGGINDTVNDRGCPLVSGPWCLVSHLSYPADGRQSPVASRWSLAGGR
jgi:hypothetical protein